MAYCATCGKPTPCGVNHKKKKPTARSRNWAAAKNAGQKPKAAGSSSSVTSRSEDEWVMRGPNVDALGFPGTVTASKGVSVKAKAAGRYFSFNLGTHITEAGLADVAVYGIVFRICLEHDAGVMGLVRDFDPSKPVPPNPLHKIRFKKGVAFGVQLLAPTVKGELATAQKTSLVIRFDTDFAVDDIVWTRDSYIQHYQKPRITIPPKVLYSDDSSSA